MDHQKLTECLETLCQSGCETVNATIVAMEENQTISAVDGLNADEYQRVLQELKAIMSVYQH
ncbi:hypothetical protein [sulfur-oxidizing endosymbiont of Gigantopelta aegis]|uniref:hypothetical protein n=1 Tax=sulfur-oxidizing endosymbiont of Gigantopelta aegis TaxID=2794934 RepID=UPI0018DD1578|nr:hypothetical protein [sulfur-oxidizing endosymbiont of Gigantopelta aegis]